MNNEMELDDEARDLIRRLSNKLCDLREQQHLIGHFDFSLSCADRDKPFFRVDSFHYLMSPPREEKAA